MRKIASCSSMFVCLLVVTLAAPRLGAFGGVGSSEASVARPFGFFVGASANVAPGVFLVQISSGSSTRNQIFDTSSLLGVGIKIGYGAFFNEVLGARAYLDSNLVRSGFSNSSVTHLFYQPSLNFDVLVRAVDGELLTFSVYGGAGLGSGFHRSGISGRYYFSKFMVQLNAGILLDFGPHSTVEFGLKFTSYSHPYESHRSKQIFVLPTRDSSGKSIKYDSINDRFLEVISDVSSTFKHRIFHLGYIYRF